MYLVLLAVPGFPVTDLLALFGRIWVLVRPLAGTPLGHLQTPLSSPSVPVWANPFGVVSSRLMEGGKIQVHGGRAHLQPVHGGRSVRGSNPERRGVWGVIFAPPR